MIFYVLRMFFAFFTFFFVFRMFLAFFACFNPSRSSPQKSVTKIHYSMAAVSGVKCSGESSDFELEFEVLIKTKI